MSLVNIIFRKATSQDIPSIVRLLADDPLGASREQYAEPLSPKYYVAFQEIATDKNNHLIVAELDSQIVGTLQLTLIT